MNSKLAITAESRAAGCAVLRRRLGGDGREMESESLLLLVKMSAASVRCVLCKIAEENDVTGALATKEDVTAHQNCLLFASGTYCRNTPDFDDLFGFSVEDVKREEQRGRRLP
ncbi:PHD finger protein 11 isoform X2 [Denticeps clupeoides]|uniref:PHD finger protein 11 isoform X2 n=1 Tax=Denticeps clupeoides TaxID=299321 RepID=UPI0010A343EE|nr:PHD finger protein 11-like isoform X2 [Denticeps clupeoides]